MIAVAAVVLVAATARVAVHFWSPLAPPLFDMAEYWDRAVYLFQHGSLYPDSWRMPGLPVCLASLFVAAGEPSPAIARVLNVVAGTTTVALTYALARRAAPVGAATAAALAVALYPSLLIHTSLITTETVVMVPLLAALLAASFDSPRARVVAGVLAGLTTVVRPAGIAVLPAVLSAAFWPRQPGAAPGRRLMALALTVAGFVLVMTPWWMHGLRVHGRFVPLDTTAGLNMLIGSGPYATGRYRFAAVTRQQTEFLTGVDTTTPEGANHAAALALAHVRANPGDAVALVPVKIGTLFALEGNELAYLYSIGQFGPLHAATVWAWGVAVLAAFPVVLTLSLAGTATKAAAAGHVRGPALWFLGVAVGLSIAAFGEPRFHLPFVPVLAVLATGLSNRRAGLHVGRAGAGATLLAFLVTQWWPQLANYLHFLALLAGPDGWRTAQSFDDLL